MARGLGKGLEGLFEDNLRLEEETDAGALKIVRTSSVEPNKSQPRKAFDKDKIDELCESVKANGILQPLIVRENGKNRYQIISGERRWRAACQAGLTEIPVIVKDMDEQQVLEIGLIENLQREDLNAVEEARGYKSLMEDFGLTQDDVSRKVSKSRSTVANSLRILALPNEVLDLVLDGRLSSGHARALLPLMEKMGDKTKFIKTANEIAAKKLSVRAVENMTKKPKSIIKKKPDFSSSIYYKEASDALTRKWGRKVTVTQGNEKNGKTQGTVVFEYYDADDLNNLIELLTDKEV